MIISICSRAGQRFLKLFTWHPSYPNHRGGTTWKGLYLTTLEHMRFNIIVNCIVSKLRMLFDSAMTMLCRCDDTHDGNACSVDGSYKSDKEYECPTLGLRFATAFVICYGNSKESQCQLSFRS